MHSGFPLVYKGELVKSLSPGDETHCIPLFKRSWECIPWNSIQAGLRDDLAIRTIPITRNTAIPAANAGPRR